MLKPCFTSKFKKDFKRLKLQGRKLVKLEESILDGFRQLLKNFARNSC